MTLEGNQEQPLKQPYEQTLEQTLEQPYAQILEQTLEQLLEQPYAQILKVTGLGASLYNRLTAKEQQYGHWFRS
ncbi:hypothetical protein M378DRAFT_19562 [Amanita muscaria Koide BX008]|uniref:Uncharacterized protein n=1 Tax=Amanita muscaria (strain Koide BX008) TaxID=946122 RepID=A0A0C2SIK9_AMAMK|nr:hypothetical protein M378DRAFT_19562 [Amanita muscaria Koide BX008]